MNKLKTCILLVLSVFHLMAEAQDKTLSQFENAVKKTFARSYHSTVKLFEYNEKSGQKLFAGSGVVVSPEGLIFTVAHVNKPGQQYIVRFPDGREVKAKGLGEITSVDAAMMKIEEPGPFPFSPPGRSASLTDGQACISLGYPGSLQLNQPTLRLGFTVGAVKDSAGRYGSLQTTCLMEPGDSGGPVFDMEGNVIGLHSRVTRALDCNYEVPVDIYLRYHNVFLSGAEYRRPPDSLAASLSKVQPESTGSKYLPYSDTTERVTKAFSPLSGNVYSVESVLGDSASKAVATLMNVESLVKGISKQSRSLLIGKSSIIGANPRVCLHNGSKQLAKVLARDEQLDLVLLELPVKTGAAGIDLNSAVDSIDYNMIGTFVYSPSPGGDSHISVVGSTPFSIANQSRSGYFGAALELKDDKILISFLAENSAAGKAGLEVGAQLLRLDRKPVSSLDDFLKRIQQSRPNDTVVVDYVKSGEELSASVILGRRPMVLAPHVSENFAGGKSVIRDGFSRTFVHDGRLLPQECGSPLLDRTGRMLGINIARLSRTSSLALPVDEVKRFLRAALSVNEV